MLGDGWPQIREAVEFIHVLQNTPPIQKAEAKAIAENSTSGIISVKVAADSLLF